MTDIQAYLMTSVGVVVAVVLPVLKGFVTSQFPQTKGEAIFPTWAKKYGALFLFGALTGLTVLAVWKTQNPSLSLEWYTAFLLGFTSEAALEKLVQKP